MRLDKKININSKLINFPLSIRMANVFIDNKIETIGQLLKKNDEELLSYRNFGVKNLEKLNLLLKEHGFKRKCYED